MIDVALSVSRAAVTHPVPTGAASWLLKLAMRTLAGALNMPEALLRGTCEFAVAYVAAVEQRATYVCPFRLWRELHASKAQHGGDAAAPSCAHKF